LCASLDWPDDANHHNNLGQQNVAVNVTSSPAEFTLRVRKGASVLRRFVLEADRYQLPDRGLATTTTGVDSGAASRFGRA
jgi:hypothetical protein